MKPCGPDASRRGFTLLEVLVALVVLAVALVALVHTAGRGVETFTDLRQRSLAAWVADNALTEVRLQPGLPDTGQRDGVARMAGRQWPWHMTISDTRANGIRRVEVAVYLPGSSPDAAAPVIVRNGFAGNRLRP